MSLTIRKAVSADLHALAEVLSKSWMSAYRNIIPLNELKDHASVERRTQKLQAMLLDSEYNLFIVFSDNIPCGEIMFCKSRDKDLGEYGEIVSFYLLEEYWYMGLGKDMMTFTCETMTSENSKNLFLWVFKDNHRARRFYEKFGFVADGAEKVSSFSNGAEKVSSFSNGAEKVSSFSNGAIEMRYRLPHKGNILPLHL